MKHIRSKNYDNKIAKRILKVNTFCFSKFTFTIFLNLCLERNGDELLQNEELSICSPLLVSSICQLLYNLTILLHDEAIMMINNNGIMSLLINYVKPINLLTKENKCFKSDQKWFLNEEMIDMLYMICRYINICCQLDPNFIAMMLKSNSNLVYDLIECLNINALNKGVLFYQITLI